MTTKGRRATIIAEIGMNHDGSLGNAMRMVDVAAESGADAVKFQTHLAEAETLRNAPMPPYFKGEPRYEYFSRTAFAPDQWRSLRSHCEAKRVEFISSPFSFEAVELLETVGVQSYKIPSGEVTNLPLLEGIAATGKPVLLSSGMSSWEELDAAVKLLRRHHDRITVLQCTSEYPCPPEHVGLNVLGEMRARYGLPVGLSDHTLPNYAAFAAAALGVSVIEKHFTLSRYLYGSDAKHSLEPAEFADLVRGVRAIEAMVASPVDKADASRFGPMKAIFQKSVVTLRVIPAGAILTPNVLGVKKPGTGIPAVELPRILGRRARRDLEANVLLDPSDFEDA